MWWVSIIWRPAWTSPCPICGGGGCFFLVFFSIYSFFILYVLFLPDVVCIYMYIVSIFNDNQYICGWYVIDGLLNSVKKSFVYMEFYQCLQILYDIHRIVSTMNTNNIGFCPRSSKEDKLGCPRSSEEDKLGPWISASFRGHSELLAENVC